MVGFSIDGLFSGLDTTAIIDALLFNTRAPAQRIATRRDQTTAKLQAVQGLNATVLSVGVAARGLRNAATFNASVATSSNQDIVRATTTGTAPPGTFNVSVQQLARAQQISSDPNNVFTDDDAALNLEGTIRVNNRNIDIRTTDSLRDIAARITNSGAGVTATVLEVDEGQFRLTLGSQSTGADGFTISDVSTNNLLEALRLGADASGDVVANPITDGAASRTFAVSLQEIGANLGLSSDVPAGTIQIANGTETVNVALDLATQSLEDIAQAINDAAGLAGSSISAAVNEIEPGSFQLEILSGDATTPTFVDDGNVLETLGVVRTGFVQVDQAGQDALFEVNGIGIVRSSNTVSDVIQDVTFNLVSDEEPDEEVLITVEQTNEGAAEAIQGFVDAFNATRDFTTRFASFDPETQTAGLLLGDSSVLTVERSLSSVLFRSFSTLAFQNLGELNGGIGVASGSIQITDAAGSTATIDLSEAETVQDVISAINANQDIEVRASVNRAGTGLVLQDETGIGGNVTVAEVAGGTTAADLGILGTGAAGRLEGSAVAVAEFINLTRLGVTFGIDGRLQFNSGEFQSFLDENPLAVEAFFTQDGGFGESVVEATDLLTGPLNGLLTSQASSLEDTIDSLNDSIERIEERAVLQEVNLRRQFTTLEQTLAQLQSEGTFLLNQLNQLSLLNSNVSNQ